MTKILDVAAHPQFAELLSFLEAGDDVILTRDGRSVAEVKSVEATGKPTHRVWGTHPDAISYIADDFDAELPESFWMGEE